jgi:hypothetical protein
MYCAYQAGQSAPDLFDDEMCRAFAVRNVQIARETGALAVLPLALNYLAQLRIFEGEPAPHDSLTIATPTTGTSHELARMRADHGPSSGRLLRITSPASGDS